jgi:tetratricopeptide (TPR) repeat protein
MRGSTELPMNRKQRRAMRMQSREVAVAGGASQPAVRAEAGRLFGQAVLYQHHGKSNEAAKLYKQVLELEPDHAEASNNLGCLLLAQGKHAAASAYFQRALMLLPQLFDDFDSSLGEGVKRGWAFSEGGGGVRRK